MVTFCSWSLKVIRSGGGAGPDARLEAVEAGADQGLRGRRYPRLGGGGGPAVAAGPNVGTVVTEPTFGSAWRVAWSISSWSVASSPTSVIVVRGMETST